MLQRVHRQIGGVRQLHQHDALRGNLVHGRKGIAATEYVKCVQHDAEVRLIGGAHDCPGVRVILDMSAPGQCLVAHDEAATGGTLGQAALRYILKDAEIVSTLPNIYDREQIEEFIGASACADVGPEDAARVETLFESNYGLPREQEAAVPSSR